MSLDLRVVGGDKNSSTKNRPSCPAILLPCLSVCLSADDSDRTVFLLVGRRASLLQMMIIS